MLILTICLIVSLLTFIGVML